MLNERPLPEKYILKSQKSSPCFRLFLLEVSDLTVSGEISVTSIIWFFSISDKDRFIGFCGEIELTETELQQNSSDVTGEGGKMVLIGDLCPVGEVGSGRVVTLRS